MNFSTYRFILLIITALSLQSEIVFANRQNASPFGAGMMVGNFTSITGKYWLNNEAAADFGVGFISSSIVIYSDYLVHIPNLFGSKNDFTKNLVGYIGAGPGLGIWTKSDTCSEWKCKDNSSSKAAFFIRGLMGLAWVPTKPTIECFFEIGPAINLTPEIDGFIHLGTGVRYLL